MLLVNLNILDIFSSGIVRQSGSATGSMEISFTLDKKDRKRDEERRKQNQSHHAERRKIRRSAGALKKDRPKGLPQSKFWMSKKGS